MTTSRARLALITGSPGATDEVVRRMATDLELGVVQLGRTLAEHYKQPPTPAEIEEACTASSLLVDLDILFWPALNILVVRFLANIARRHPVLAVWPGEISAGRARYSSPGRADHHDARLSDVLVLRPRATRFPDEVPYEIERIAQ